MYLCPTAKLTEPHEIFVGPALIFFNVSGLCSLSCQTILQCIAIFQVAENPVYVISQAGDENVDKCGSDIQALAYQQLPLYAGSFLRLSSQFMHQYESAWPTQASLL